MRVRRPTPVFTKAPEPERTPERVAARPAVSTVEVVAAARVAGTEEVRAEPATRRVPPEKLKAAVPSLRRPLTPPRARVPPEFRFRVPL